MGSFLSMLEPTTTTAENKNIQIKREKNKKFKHLSSLVDELGYILDTLEKENLKNKLKQCLSTAVYMRNVGSGPLSYQQLLDYVNNTQEVNHKFGIEVNKIFYICHKEEADFTKFCKNNGGAKGRPRMMLWHGTTLDRVTSIIEQGFSLPEYKDTDRVKRLQGHGLYFADRVTKSAQYCDPHRRPKHYHKACLLLCDVLLGNTFYSTEPNTERFGPPNNYHSVACEGKLTPDADGIHVVEAKTDEGNLILPSGESIPNKKFDSYNLEFNEFIVYNPEQIKIRYLVFFTFTPNRHENVMLQRK